MAPASTLLIRRWKRLSPWYRYISLSLCLCVFQILWSLNFIERQQGLLKNDVALRYPLPILNRDLIQAHPRPKIPLRVIETTNSTQVQQHDDATNGTRNHNHHHSTRLLRFDWTNLSLTSTLAHRIQQHQQNCNLPLANFRYRNRFGLGSDLHCYSQALCNALEAGDVRVWTVQPWIWMDQVVCSPSCNNGTTIQTTSAMVCYFPQAELVCPNDKSILISEQVQLRNMTRGRGRIRDECPQLRAQYGIAAIRAATTEYLFSHVSSAIQMEAERQARAVFGDRIIPNNLITVHIRWGDKSDEMTLVPIVDYVKAVKQLIAQRSDGSIEHFSQNTGTTAHQQVNIFLATEDPQAYAEFCSVAPSNWIIYVDQYFHEMLPYRRQHFNGSPLMAQDLHGKPGLVALGSLLVAMEANDFVLTTASNWSRLINELRQNILNPRCDNCTKVVDLKYGEW